MKERKINSVTVAFTRKMWTEGRGALPSEEFDPPITVEELTDRLKKKWQLLSMRIENGVAKALVKGH